MYGYTVEELTTMLSEVKVAISKCLTAQEFMSGLHSGVRRALLKDLHDREKWLIQQIAAQSGGVGEGFDPANKVEFFEPGVTPSSFVRKTA